MSGPIAMKHFANAQKEYKPPLIANENAFLGDVYSSDHTNPEHPISCGFYRLEKGNVFQSLVVVTNSSDIEQRHPTCLHLHL